MKQLNQKIMSLVLSFALLFSLVLPTYGAVTETNSTREQVIYVVNYLDKESNESIYPASKKIGFVGTNETVKAIDVNDYSLISESPTNFNLLNSGDYNNVINFYYVKTDTLPDPLLDLKNEFIQKINSLNNITAKYKKSYISKIQSAKSKELIYSIFDDAKTSDINAKIQVKYTIRYLDHKTQAELINPKTKLGFANEKVSENPLNIKGYQFLSTNSKTLILTENNNQSIIFEYTKIDLTTDYSKALKTLNTYVFIPQNKKAEIIENLNNASTQEEINKILKDAETLNINSVKQVKYTINHVDMVTGKILKTSTKIDFQSVIVTEKALEFKGYGLASPDEQQIILNPDKDNTIVFNYKKFDDDTIPLQEFLRKKIDYQYPLIYKNTDFTGRPEALKEYLIKKMHNGDLYAKFTATKADQEKAYWDIFNKSHYSGNVRFVRNWTIPDDTNDKTTPMKFTIGFTYVDNKNDMIAAENMMQDFVRKNITDDMTAVEKVHIIHDYILNKGSAAITKEGASMHQLKSGRPTNSSVAFMLENKAVCEGYAMTFNRLAEIAGVESIFICGRYTPEWYFDAYHITPDKYNERFKKILNTPAFDKGVNHSWNIVKLDNGKWYHVDTYHDDFFSISNPGMRQEHIRFLKSDKFFIQHAGRYWNFAYTPKADEDYYGNFDFIKDFK